MKDITTFPSNFVISFVRNRFKWYVSVKSVSHETVLNQLNRTRDILLLDREKTEIGNEILGWGGGGLSIAHKAYFQYSQN